MIKAKKEVFLKSIDGKIKYIPGVVLEICAEDKKMKVCLEKLSSAILKAGILADSIWTTSDNTSSFYTLPIFLPKGLEARISKFKKETFDKYHSHK